jgi:hypothetical protein
MLHASCPTCLPYMAVPQQLQHLDLWGYSIGVDGAAALGPHLPALSCLQDLSIGWNGLGAVPSLYWLKIEEKPWRQRSHCAPPHLAVLSAHVRLDLEENALGANGAVALSPHLAALTQLQHLNLADNGLDALLRSPLTLRCSYVYSTLTS